MKINLLKSLGFILFFTLIISGCTLEEYLYGVVVEDRDGILEKEVQGVKFSFCLLNEKGMPANVFKQGENFLFQFQIKNKTSEPLPFYDYWFYNTKDFFNVRSGEVFLGKPMKFLNFITAGEVLEIAPEETQAFTMPWHAEEIEFQRMNGLFEGLHQPELPKGKYFTKFTYNFRFGYPDKKPQIETGKMTFVINFEIR